MLSGKISIINGGGIRFDWKDSDGFTRSVICYDNGQFGASVFKDSPSEVGIVREWHHTYCSSALQAFEIAKHLEPTCSEKMM